MRVTLLTLAILASLATILPGCAGTKKTGVYTEDARIAYEQAMEAFDNEDCITAEPLFREIRSNYPYTRYAALSELREADCLAIQDKHMEAI